MHSRVNAELFEIVPEVRVGGVGRDEEFLGDLLIRISFSCQTYPLRLQYLVNEPSPAFGFPDARIGAGPPNDAFEPGFGMRPSRRPLSIVTVSASSSTSTAMALSPCWDNILPRSSSADA